MAVYVTAGLVNVGLLGAICAAGLGGLRVGTGDGVLEAWEAAYGTNYLRSGFEGIAMDVYCAVFLCCSTGCADDLESLSRWWFFFRSFLLCGLSNCGRRLHSHNLLFPMHVEHGIAHNVVE